MKKEKSFTLIELLVIIAIIGFLASVVIINLGSGKKRAHDARRVQEIDRLFKAMELCYSDKGNYPNSDSFWDRKGATGWCYTFSCSTCFGNFQDAMTQCVYVNIRDPINVDPNAYYYFYFTPTSTVYNGVPINSACKGHYALMAHLELPKYANTNTGQACFDETGQNEFWRILGY